MRFLTWFPQDMRRRLPDHTDNIGHEEADSVEAAAVKRAERSDTKAPGYVTVGVCSPDRIWNHNEPISIVTVEFVRTVGKVSL